MTETSNNQNPLLEPPTPPFEVPPFSRITPDHFPPAFTRALAEHVGEVEAIAAERAAPTFENTIVALERSGWMLARVTSLFYVLAGAHTNDALLKIERDMAPRLSAHWDRIYLNEALFRRIEAVREQSASGLTAEQQRVLERYHVTFRRAGGGLDRKAKRRLAEIGEQLASLGAAFSQNVLADEQAYALVLEGEPELAGLPDFVRVAARSAAEERGFAGKHVVTLSRSSVVPFLQFSARPDLREKVFRAWIARGEGGGESDNTGLIAEMVKLRAERARILGYPTFADYRLDDSMAKTPGAVLGLLDAVWEPARRRMLEERDALQGLIRAEGSNLPLMAADWRYFAEKLRKTRFDLSEEEIKPYLQLDKMIAAAFYVAERLFGLTFAPRDDVLGYHPDVRVWEVRARDGRHLGLFFGDYFARASKRSGAWMTTLRDQHKLDGDVRPLVVNVMNFAKSEGEPTLLSFDDARTLFHEFGHGLHGLLSDVTYPMIAGTNVLQDFVELPSQLFEHWLEQPQILHQFATNYRTGEPMPEELLARLLRTRAFNQGFATTEMVASAFVDMDFHQLGPDVVPDAETIERQTRGKMGLPDEVVLRHRPPHFLHIFAGDGYAAGYYSYLWSEVLDADAFDAFEEAGDIFDPATAKRLHDFVYAAGGVRDPEEAYIKFRGRLPTPEALLRRRGLTTDLPTG
jgi:peptidyl-dipeptidase Dcp